MATLHVMWINEHRWNLNLTSLLSCDNNKTYKLDINEDAEKCQLINEALTQ